jgi:hypothetical protein
MTPFEQELKKALARREPSADFTGRLFARLAKEEAVPSSPWWRSLLRWPSRLTPAFAMVCTLIVVTGGTLLYKRQEERALQGERAKEQVLLALRITGQKLHATRRQVHEVESGNNPRRIL